MAPGPPSRPRRAPRRRPAAGGRQPDVRFSIDPDDPLTRAFLAGAAALAGYHRHQVLHLERLATLLREGRRVVLVGNHALDIVDPLLFCAAVFRETRRVPRFIGHENGWFKVPVMRDIASHFQIIASRQPEETVEALRRDGLLMLYPGANREAALRSYRDEPYRLIWRDRLGFLRIALEAEAEIVFVAALGIDEAYYQSVLPTPDALIRYVNGGDADRYRGAKLGFGLLGPHLVPGLLPFPVRLTHVVSEPLDLGDRKRALSDPMALADLHEQVWKHCQSFLDQQVARREAHSDALDRGVRGVQDALRGLGL